MNRNKKRDRVKKEKLEEKQSQKGETEKVSGAKRVNISAGDDKITLQYLDETSYLLLSIRTKEKMCYGIERVEQTVVEQNIRDYNRIEQNRVEQNRTEQTVVEQNITDYNRREQNRIEHNRIVHNSVEQ